MIRTVASFAVLAQASLLVSACTPATSTERVASASSPKQAQAKGEKTKKACHADNDTGSIIAASGCPSRN